MQRLALTIALSLLATPAFAHADIGAGSSFMSGFTHPLGGADHLLAMVTVGLWAALVGGRALWLWPTAFVAAMLAGGALRHGRPAMCRWSSRASLPRRSCSARWWPSR